MDQVTHIAQPGWDTRSPNQPFKAWMGPAFKAVQNDASIGAHCARDMNERSDRTKGPTVCNGLEAVYKR